MTSQSPAAATAALQTTEPAGRIVAVASRDYRWRRYLFSLIVFALGLYFAYDGWIAWPAENAQVHDLLRKRDEAQAAGNANAVADLTAQLKPLKPHSEWDLLLQRVLGFALPPVALVALLTWLRRSGGSYVLDLGAQTLSVRGQAPVSLSAITSIDRSLWDRKGIARVHYTAADGSSRRLSLDDFIYQRQPTDEIVKHIEDRLSAAAGT
jgi:hypothetical protein